MKTFPKSREEKLVVQELKDEILIYDLKINKAFCLNETSALVWQLCDGNNSVSDINNELSKKLKQTSTEELVWLAIDDLKKHQLLDNSQEITINYNGLSRREVIKKAGLASMIALPIVSSLIAPAAAQAQSPAAVCDQTAPCQCVSNVAQTSCLDTAATCEQGPLVCTRCQVTPGACFNVETTVICPGTCRP